MSSFNYPFLGKSDLKISQIGFGCMSLKRDPVNNNQLFQMALDQGINFFDTADLYQRGLNESEVGRLLLGTRHRVILATKVGNQWSQDRAEPVWNPSKKYILSQVDESLRRLQTEYIDLYQLHGGTMEDPIDEIIEAFEILQDLGKIRYYGISSIRPQVIREYVKRSSIISVMMQYSLLDRRPQKTCLELLRENRIGVLARGILAGGLLAGKPPVPYLDYTLQQVEIASGAIRERSSADRSPAQTAIRYALHHPAITSAVIGIHQTSQLQEVVETLSTPELLEEDFRFLEQSIPPNFYHLHR
ncbi:MAG: aldo/keto reductase [Chitinophagaceae bacterium]